VAQSPHGIARRRAASPLRLILGVVALAAPLVAGSVPGDNPKAPALARAKRELRRHHPTLARSAILVHLSRQPGSIEGYAVLAGTETMSGWASEALAVIPWGEQSSWYARIGRALHADSLRELGRGREAAQMRLGLLRDEDSGVSGVDVASDLVDDLRAAGAHDEAVEALAEGVARWPRATLLHAVAADLALDAGDLEEARSWLWLADVQSTPVLRVRMVRARLARLDGDLLAAQATLVGIAKRRPRSAPVRALQAHVLCDLDEPAAAVALLERQALFTLGQSEVLIAHARALWLTGDQASAREEAEWISVRYPAHADLPALLALMGEPQVGDE
jgi:predicted Zn-dependent protease